MSKKKSSSSIALLFVCFGNICRSPVFVAIINHLAEEGKEKGRVVADSCGLDKTFVGAKPHELMRQIAAERGIALEGCARLFDKRDFALFDAIFGVTNQIVSELNGYATTEEERQKIFLASHFSAKYRDQDILDPYYYAEPSSFEAVFDVIEEVAQGIYRHFVTS